MTFDTPWTPPLAWLEKAAEAFPDVELILYWEEEGNQDCGKAWIEDNAVRTIPKPCPECDEDE